MKTFQKIIVSCLCGILFGSFAAVSFFAVREIGVTVGILEDNNDRPASEFQDTDDDEETADVVENSTQQDEMIPVYYTVKTDVTEVVDEVMPAIVSITNHLTYDYYYYTREAEASGSGIIIGSNESEYHKGRQDCQRDTQPPCAGARYGQTA